MKYDSSHSDLCPVQVQVRSHFSSDSSPLMITQNRCLVFTLNLILVAFVWVIVVGVFILFRYAGCPSEYEDGEDGGDEMCFR
jgi:hypothetical protein